MKNINVCGMFTHLCCSDSNQPNDIEFTRCQIDSFYSLIDKLKQDGVTVPKIHIQSSYGLWNYPDLKCDYVRAGVALYGVLSSPNDKTKLKLNLRPVLSLKSQIVLIRTVNKGEGVGYGQCFVAESDRRIAIVPIGYGDGLSRSLSCENGYVSIRGHCVPIVGRICMDQCTVDVTDYDEVVVGDSVTIISSQTDDELSAPMVASRFSSISNELLCRMGTRLPIIVK